MSTTRIYIVEDEALIAQEISDCVTHLGYEVCGQTTRGERALEEIPRIRPDIVLMDICLAGELNGIDTVARLRQLLAVPVIFLSAPSDAQLVEKALGAEPFGYLIKPFEARELHATIQAALYKHRLECSLQDANARLEEAVRQRTADLRQSEAEVRALNENLERLVTERTSKLRASEERYRYLMLAMPGAVYEFCIDAAGHRSLPFISNGIADLMGISPDEAMADVEVVFQRIPLDALPAMDESIRHSLETLSPWLHEFPIRVTTGEVKWLRGHSVPRREQDGSTCWTGVLVDTTERKRVEESLAASKKQLQDILDSVFGFVAIYTLDGRIVEIIRAPLALGGIAKADVMDRYFWETPWWSGLPDMQSRVQDWMRRAAQGELVRGELVFRVPGRQRSTADAVFGPLRDTDGAIINVIGFGVDITERKQTEAALRVSEERLLEAQRIAQMGNWELDLERNILTWSDEVFRIFEIDKATFGASYEAFTEAVHPDDRDKVKTAYTSSLQTRKPYEIIHRLRMADGRIKYVQERCETKYSAEGHPLRSMGTVQEITAHELVEEELQRSEAFITSVVDNLPLMVFVKDAANLRFVRLNKAGEALLGYSHHELLGKSGYDFFPKEEVDFFTAADRTVLRDRRLLDIPEEPIQTKEHGRRILHTKKIPICDADGTPQFLLGISEDITERKQTEQALTKSERLFRTLAQGSPVGIFRTDATGGCVYVNDRWCEIAGRSADSAAGFGWNAALHPDDRDRVAEEWTHALKNHRPFRSEYRFQPPGQMVTWVVGQARAEFDQNGDLVGYVGTITDITDRKRMEEALRQQKLELRAAIEERERISQDLHDGILQSLFAVGLTLETTKSMLSPGSRKTSGASLNETIDQLNRVMREIRNFIAGLGSDLLEGKDFPTALQHMLDSLMQNQVMRVRLAVEDRAAQAVSTEQALHLLQITQEAVSNCIKHSRAQEVTVSLKLLKQGVRLSIRDNGRGFNPKAAKGTGHGLRNMASRAQKVGGRLTLFSKINEGTRVVLDVPHEASDAPR